MSSDYSSRSSSFSSRVHSSEDEDFHKESKKVSKINVRQFIQTSAAASSSDSEGYDEHEEEEEENNDGFIDENDENNSRFTDYIYQDRKEHEEERRRIIERYKSASHSGYINDTETVIVHDHKALYAPFSEYRIPLEPTKGSNMLFLAKVIPGKEFKVLSIIFKRVFKGDDEVSVLNPRYQLNFASFTPQIGCSYIYIESQTYADAVSLVSNIVLLKSPRLTSVPLKEMTHAITISRKPITLHPGQFVQIRRNPTHWELYKNDVAQVIKVNINQNTVMLKIVPRIDYELLKTEGNKNLEGYQSRLTKQKKGNYRPPLVLFQPETLENECGAIIHRTNQLKIGSDVLQNAFEYDGRTFYKGFLYIEMSIKYINQEEYKPDADQAKYFLDNIFEFENSIPGFLENMYSAVGKSTLYTFQPGDIARVNQGHEYGNLVVLVKRIENEIAVVTPVSGNDIELSIETAMLHKYFSEGNKVEVLAGDFKGKIGYVQSVNETDSTATIFLPSINQPSTLLLANLSHTKKEESIQTTIGPYKLHEYVRLHGERRGVIWRIEHNTIYILLEDGNSTVCDLAQIRSRNNDGYAQDSNHTLINVGSNVMARFDNRNHHAVVLHTSRDHVFLKSNDIIENGGVFLCPPNYITVQYSSLNNQNSSKQQTSQMSQNSRPTNDKTMIGKTIRFVKGANRGLLADIKECNSKDMRVLIQSNGRSLRIPRSNADYIILNEESGRPSNNSTAPHFSGATYNNSMNQYSSNSPTYQSNNYQSPTNSYSPPNSYSPYNHYPNSPYQ